MLLGVYTAILLSAFSARPFWNTGVLAPLFLVSGLSTAAALVALLAERPAGVRRIPDDLAAPTYWVLEFGRFDLDDRRGAAHESIVGAGVVISGGTARRSIVSSDVRIHSYASVEDSLLLNGVVVGRNAVVRRAIIDKNVVIPEGFEIGVDEAADRERFTVTESGLVVIGKGDTIDPV